MTRFYAAGAFVLAVVFLAAIAGYTILRGGSAADDLFADCRTAKIAGEASIGGPFELLNSLGQTVTDKDVITKPSLLYFGYTFCPDVCPLDNARNAEAVDLLAERGIDVTPVFISIDPKRDTPEVVGEFTSYLSPKMVGLTGSPEQVAAAARAYRAFYRRQDSGDDEFYFVDHSTFTYLVFPEHGFAEFFRRALTANEVADRVACFVDAST